MYFTAIMRVVDSEEEKGGYVVTLPPEPVANSSYSNMKSLVDDMLSGYDKRIRPALWQANTLKVTASFVPISIVELDISRQSMTVNGYFVFNWKDELFRWDKIDHSGTNLVRIPLYNIWYPKVILREVRETNQDWFAITQYTGMFLVKLL